jgi:hypothetical protein
VNRSGDKSVKLEGKGVKLLRLRGKKAMEINEADVAELVDARDLKSLDGNVVRVRVPPPAPIKSATSRTAGPNGNSLRPMCPQCVRILSDSAAGVGRNAAQRPSHRDSPVAADGVN